MKLAIISYLGDCLQSWGFPNWSGARDGEDQQEIKEHLQRRSETNPTKTTKIEVEAKKRRGRGILIVNDLSFLALPLSFSISVELWLFTLISFIICSCSVKIVNLLFWLINYRSNRKSDLNLFSLKSLLSKGGEVVYGWPTDRRTLGDRIDLAIGTLGNEFHWSEREIHSPPPSPSRSVASWERREKEKSLLLQDDFTHENRCFPFWAQRVVSLSLYMTDRPTTTGPQSVTWWQALGSYLHLSLDLLDLRLLT